MYSFERFVARGNIKLEKFFKEIGVTSDEELREYCISKNLSVPKEKYFPDEPIVEESRVEEIKKPEKPKVSRKTKKVEPESEPEAEVKPEKKPVTKPKTTRRRTRKKTET